MDLKNAIGLLVTGIAMRAIPDLEPGWFQPAVAGGSNASAIWMTCMGTIEAAMGFWYLLKTGVLPALRQRRSRRGASAPVPRPVSRPQVVLGR
ncbi:MAG: hypothetical protein ACREFX_05515 [Opitutaceae bacterium]